MTAPFAKRKPIIRTVVCLTCCKVMSGRGESAVFELVEERP